MKLGTGESGVRFSSRYCYSVTSDRLFSSKLLVLKYKVVLQLSRLCLLANFPASTITCVCGGEGGGG